LADLLKEERGYFDAVMAGYLNPEHYDRKLVLQHRHAARIAIANAQSSVQRARLEPGSGHVTSNVAQGVLDATQRLTGALLALDASSEQFRDRGPLPEIGHFATTVDRTMAELEAVLRDGETPATLESNQELADSVEALRQRDERTVSDSRLGRAFFVSQADRIGDSLDTMRHVLTTRTEMAT